MARNKAIPAKATVHQRFKQYSKRSGYKLYAVAELAIGALEAQEHAANSACSSTDTDIHPGPGESAASARPDGLPSGDGEESA